MAPIVALTKEIKNPEQTQNQTVQKVSWSSAAVQSALEVFRKIGQSPRSVSTSMQDTTHEDIKANGKDYKTFVMQRSAWIKEHGAGINEVKALRNIFYSFLFAVKQNGPQRSR